MLVRHTDKLSISFKGKNAIISTRLRSLPGVNKVQELYDYRYIYQVQSDVFLSVGIVFPTCWIHIPFLIKEQPMHCSSSP